MKNAYQILAGILLLSSPQLAFSKPDANESKIIKANTAEITELRSTFQGEGEVTIGKKGEFSAEVRGESLYGKNIVNARLQLEKARGKADEAQKLLIDDIEQDLVRYQVVLLAKMKLFQAQNRVLESEPREYSPIFTACAENFHSSWRTRHITAFGKRIEYFSATPKRHKEEVDAQTQALLLSIYRDSRNILLDMSSRCVDMVTKRHQQADPEELAINPNAKQKNKAELKCDDYVTNGVPTSDGKRLDYFKGDMVKCLSLYDPETGERKGTAGIPKVGGERPMGQIVEPAPAAATPPAVNGTTTIMKPAPQGGTVTTVPAAPATAPAGAAPRGAGPARPGAPAQ